MRYGGAAASSINIKKNSRPLSGIGKATFTIKLDLADLAPKLEILSG